MTIKQIQHGYALEHKDIGVLLRFYTNTDDSVVFSDDLDDPLFIVETLEEAHRALYNPASHWANSTLDNPQCPDHINLNNYQIVQCEILIKTEPSVALPNTLSLNKAILYTFSLNKTTCKLYSLAYSEGQVMLTGVLINSALFPREQVSVGDIFYRAGMLCKVARLESVTPDIQAKLAWLNKGNPSLDMYLIVSEPYTFK